MDVKEAFEEQHGQVMVLFFGKIALVLDLDISRYGDIVFRIKNTPHCSYIAPYNCYKRWVVYVLQ
jgi:hypothetical protein